MPHIWKVEMEERSRYHAWGNGMYITEEQSVVGIEKIVFERLEKIKPSEKSLERAHAEMLCDPPYIKSITYVGFAHQVTP